MKKIAYVAAFVSLSFLFVAAYYCCYYYASNRLQVDISGSADNSTEIKEQLTDVNAASGDVVNDKTEYILETYNIDSETITKETLKVPAEYLGMNRDEMIDYLSVYRESMSKENISNIQLVSFSKSCIIIRKSIKEDTSKYSYWVTADKGIVIVYKADKKEVYLDTGIDLLSLENEDREKINKGFYIENIKTLYNYLETITS